MTEKRKRLPERSLPAAGTSWEGVAEWYDALLEKGGETYQERVILPNALRLLALRKGDSVLDLACGQGFFSRAFSAAGAAVAGFDASPALIALAKKRSPAAIRFGVAPARAVDLPDASVNKAALILALQNMAEIQPVLSECGRVLTPDGIFLVVLNHPAFRIPRFSRWGFDENGGVQYRRLDGYLSESRAEILMHPGKNSGETTVSFHRPLQAYAKAFEKAGFSIRRIEEWTSPKKSGAGPRQAAENRARREFPLFLALLLAKR